MNPDRTLVEDIAAEAVSMRHEVLPDDVLRRARQCLLDQFGVQLRGATLAQVQPVLEFVKDSGGSPQATVVWHGLRTSVGHAAMVNGTFGHSCEFDDSHYDCGHPGVCVIPAALAMAEHRHASGRELLTAIVAGYQAMARVVGPIHRATLDTGWHGTKVGGVFGAAAAASKLLGLDERQCAHALSIAASDASGTMEYDQSGGEVKRLHAGLAARAGLQAAQLAALGLTGPRGILEGRRGIHRLFGGGQDARQSSFRDSGFHILNTIFKLYPSVGTTHAAIHGLSILRQHHHFDASMVERIDVGLADWAIPHGAAISRPEDTLGAQFSLAFSLALCLQKGTNALQDYLDPRCWSDPSLQAIAAKVRPRPVTMEVGATQLGAVVNVTLRDGQVYEYFQRHMPGSPQAPATDEQLRAKFDSLVDGIVTRERSRQLMVAIDHIDSLDDVSTLAGLFTNFPEEA